ncbi:TIGR03545 family protein [Thiosulfativibrio zosterae]|uniref:TIGR03545 family protein n=1 Tax=Thiosulfativibrio zosterae TaxID=2675053 RepID=A0A6F8PKC6_9GAMM|nr:TIGR03545 family protein [Thiosulfativibrio zosterae]BBP42450.1 hypothetical protein THMIRHAT_01960 [Thiosulfativibrio zosterae]
MTQTAIKNPSPTSAAPAPASTPAPKGWIRWSGIAIFSAIIGGIVGLSYLGISLFLKKEIQHYASQAWGAQVDIGSLGLSFSPLGVEVNQIALTDPEQPMQNLLQIQQIKATMNLYHWVVGRTVIEDVNFNGFAMHQPRQSAGAIYKTAEETAAQKADKKASQAFNLPQMSLPDPQEILARETLKTVTAGQEIQAEIAKIDQAWSNLQAKLPNEATVKDYQKRFEALSKGDFSNPAVILQKQKDFEALKKEIEAHKKTLDEGQALLKQVNALKTQAQKLPDLPQQDYDRLMAKYSFSEQGLSNVTYLLFGPKIQGWLDTAQAWRVKLQPVIEYAQSWQAKRAKEAAEAEATKAARAFGTVVNYREYDPQPKFIVKRIHGDGNIDWGHVELAIKQLNFDHAVSKIPVTFKIDALPVKQKSPLIIMGESNYVHPEKPINRANFTLADYALSEARLSDDKTLPVVMKQGQMSLQGQMSWLGGDQIKADVDTRFSQVALDATASDSKEVKKYIAPIFADISEFTVQSAITGDAFAPKVDAKSDLDKLLSKAFNKVLDAEIASAKQQVKQYLDTLLNEQMGPINQQLSKLLGEQSTLKAQDLDLDAILNGKLPGLDQKSLEKKAKAEAEKALEKEKEKLKAQAQAEAEKAISDKAKNILKGFGF